MRTVANLQEAHSEAYDRIAAKATGVDFVHASLIEKRFDDEDDRAKRGKLLQIVVYHFASCHSIRLVHANINSKASWNGDEHGDDETQWEGLPHHRAS